MKVFNQIETKKTNVNSKRLVQAVDDVVMSYIDDDSISWDNENWRGALESILDEHMEVLANETKGIDRWKITCNNRNNPPENIANNKYKLDVYFQQTNCLNITHLQYCITWYIISKYDPVVFHSNW